MNRRSREKESCDVQEEEELLCCIYKQSVGVSLEGLRLAGALCREDPEPNISRTRAAHSHHSL